MQIVIEIPKDTYERVMNPDKFYRDIDAEKIRWAVYKGTVLSKHGRLIDADELEIIINKFESILYHSLTILEARSEE